jgi:hypothetical protein
LAAPEIGKRLVHNSGALAACERAIADPLTHPALSGRPDLRAPKNFLGVLGEIAGAMVRSHGPAGDAFMDVHGERVGEAVRKIADPLAIMSVPAHEARASRARSATSQCACRAQAAINKGHGALALFTATGGLVAWSPVGMWPAAMAAPDVVAQCKEVA